MTDIKLEPRCVHGGRDPSFNIDGFFLPCCWCDNRTAKKQLEFFGIFHDEFFIDNLNTPEDVKAVFKSDEWQFFYDTIENNPNNAPDICKHHCKVRDGKRVNMTQKIDEEGRDIAAASVKLIDMLDLT